MHVLRRALLASAIAAVVGTVGAETASAAPCVSSTANSTSYADPLGDGDYGLAPDIASGSVALDGACNFTLTYSIPGQSSMLSDDFLGWFINSDNSLSTGSQAGFEGADYAVGRLSSGSSTLLKYNPATGKFETYKVAQPSGAFGVQTALSDYDATQGATFAIAGASSWDGAYDTYFDFAPNVGLPPATFQVQFASQVAPTSPAPPSQPAPTAPTGPVTPIAPHNQPAVDLADCRVPVLKGLSVRAARNRLATGNCSVGRLTRVKSRSLVGRVIRSSPRSRTRLANGAKVNLVVGKRVRSIRKASAADLAETNRMINALAGTH
jgi:hypothetical protein